MIGGDPSTKEGFFIGSIKPDSVVLMGDFVIILANDKFDDQDERESYYTHLLAVSLKDSSVQQVRGEIREKTFSFWAPSLQKYNENQIIAFRDGRPEMITIESFQRKIFPVKRPCLIIFKALSVKWQPIEVKGKFRSCQDAQIYKDCLYVFDQGFQTFESTLWCYDLSTIFLLHHVSFIFIRR